MNRRLTADEFMNGLFAALALHRRSTSLDNPEYPDVRISIRGDRFDTAVEAVFQRLTEEAASRKIDVRFRVRLHPIHRDSAVVRDAIYAAAQSSVVSLDNPEYQDIRIRLDERQAEALLKRTPGGRDLFERLATEFLTLYAPAAL